MKALKAFDRYDEKVSKSAWIYRITQNHLSNYFRDTKININIDEVQIFLQEEDGRVTMEKQEGLIKLKKALDALSDTDRELVTLKHLHGYTYIDMSAILNKSANALKVATHRAMNELKRIIK